MYSAERDCGWKAIELKRLLLFETPEYTGATTATRVYASIKAREYQVSFALITPGKESQTLISEALNNVSPDIVFCSFSILNPEVIRESKKRGIKVVVRSDYKLSDIHPFTLSDIRQTYPMADRVLVQSEQLKEEMMCFFESETINVDVWETPLRDYLYEKSNVAVSPFPDNKKFHFLWVGRYSSIKDLPTLIKAFKYVIEEFENVELYLVGEIKYSISEKGIIQIGFLDNPYPWIKKADCLILSSISEAQPNVIREALILGTDVISSRCFYPSNDIISNIEWFDVGDSESLAKLMENKVRGYK